MAGRTCTACVALALALTGAGATSIGDSGSPWQGWTSLEMKARAALFLSGKVEMQRNERAGKTLFLTRTTARFMGATIARTRTRTVIDKATGRTRKYSSISPKRGRLYTFGDNGYSVDKLRPDNGYEAPLDQWGVKSHREFPYPEAGCGGCGKGVSPVLDYYGMLLRLGKLGLDEVGDEVTVQVATSRGAEPYRVSVAERRTRELEYRELPSGKRRSIEVQELRLLIAPADEEDDEGFMGMKGVAEIWVEARTKTLLSISGKIPRVGRVVLELKGLGHPG